jgi:hypothetical protein
MNGHATSVYAEFENQDNFWISSQSEYGPKGQGCSKPREKLLYVAGPI